MANPYGDPSAIEEQVVVAGKALSKFQASHDTKSPDEKKLEADAHAVIGKVGDFFGIMVAGVNIVEKMATSVPVVSFMDGMVHLLNEAEKHIGTLLHHDQWKPGAIGKEFGDVIATALLGDTLGIKLETDDDANKKAIDAIKSLVGFTALFPYAAAGVSAVGKFALANRWPESAGEILSSLPEQLGMGFMLGTLFENIFEQATGRPLEEAINMQVHPNRLDMMTVRALGRQHHLTEDEFHKALDKLGYPADLRKLIQKLDDSQMSPAELQQAWLTGKMTADAVKTYLNSLGYSDTDAEILYSNYIIHAETGAMSVLRTSARSSFIDKEIEEGQFRAILQQTQTPDASIDIEIQAAKLRRDAHSQKLTVSNIKSMYESKILDPDVVHTQLSAIGYSDQDIADLIKLWDSPANVRAKELPVGKILSYVAADVMDPQTAQAHLVSLGYRTDDAAFMVSHPKVKAHVPPIANKATTIIAATRDKLLDPNSAIQMLVASGLSQTEAQLEVEIAQYYIEHRGRRAVATKSLTVAEIGQAINYGLRDVYWAITAYEDIGYTAEDALLLAAIAAKTTEEAIQSGTGFTPTPPPPPRS